MRELVGQIEKIFELVSQEEWQRNEALVFSTRRIMAILASQPSEPLQDKRDKNQEET